MIICKSEVELNLMREAGRNVAETHRLLTAAVLPGITTNELDRIAEETIRSQEAVPFLEGINGFAGNRCVSVNEELIHDISGDRVLDFGNMNRIEVIARYTRDHVDSAWTCPIGKRSPMQESLLQATEQSLICESQASETGSSSLHDLPCDSASG